MSQIILADAQGNIVPKRKAIPEEARLEIIRLAKELAEVAQKLSEKRDELRNFILNTHQVLGIPSNEFWDIADDASYFEFKFEGKSKPQEAPPVAQPEN